VTAQRLELGFLSFVPNPYGPGGEGRALRDGIRLFQHAEQLGFDTGWIRSRHFEQFPSSPLTLLSAIAQHTSRIRLGTGVIPLRWEDPIRLAEDAATVDLLSDGRLELGVSSGIGGFAPIFETVFGESERSFSDESQLRLARLRDALGGVTVAHSGRGFMSIPPETELTVTPAAPGLAQRIWYGPGTVASAVRTGEQGLDVLVSTLNSEETGLSFSAGQAEQLRAYKAAFAASDAAATRTPRVSAGRIVLPFLSSADAEPYTDYIAGHNARMDDEGRPLDARMRMRFDRIHSGEPARIVDGLLADEAVAELTELTITLPAPGGIDAHLRTLDLVAEHVAPALGWTPAA
jgi:alkanesulfonate monooxygenase SsuD/methylene tetrahydromethanopterin reductase-like flavin-dependent oxidoreductase (luciferase family)